MKIKTGTSKANKAWKQPLKEEVSYEWTANIYTDPAEMVAAGDQMSLKEQMVARNADAVNKARTAARELKFAAMGLVKPTAENDPRIAWEELVDSILVAKLPNGKPKFTKEKAQEQATMILGYDPNSPDADTEDSDEESEVTA